MLTGYLSTLPTDTLLNAGVLYSAKAGVLTAIGVTDGAPDFDPGVELSEVMFDNRAPSRLKGLTRRVGFQPVFKGTLKEFGSSESGNQIAVLEAGESENVAAGVTTVTAKAAGSMYAAGDYIPGFRWVFERAGGGYAAIYAPLAIVRKWTKKGVDKKEAQISFEIEAVGDPVNDLSTAPYTIELRTSLTILMTADQLIASLQSAGHDVLAMWQATDVPTSPVNGTHWSPHYAKPGVTIPDLVMQTSSVAKTTNGSTTVARFTGGYAKTAAAVSAFDLSTGLAVYVISTGNDVTGCIAAVQDAQDFGTPTRRMALVTDNATQSRNHPNLDYASSSHRYHLRCALDSNLRSWGFGVAPFVGGESGARYNVQRSADHAVEDPTDIVPGRGNWGTGASDITPSAGANWLQIGQSSGLWGSTQLDVAAVIVCATPQDANSALLVQRYGEDSLGAFKETSKRVVAIGDSLQLQITSGRPDLSSFDYSSASVDGGNATLAAAMPAGFELSCAAWQGESAWSALNKRRSFLYPLWLNARSRTELVVTINLGVNDLPWNANYQDPGGQTAINANLIALIQWIRTLPNAANIKIIVNDLGPAWIDGAANPTNAIETTRVAVNALYAAQSGTYDRLRKVSLDSTIGQPGQNMNATNYIQVDGLFVHYQETAGAGPGLTIRRSMMSTDVAAVA